MIENLLTVLGVLALMLATAFVAAVARMGRRGAADVRVPRRRPRVML